MRTFGTSLAKNPRWNEPVGLMRVCCRASWIDGHTMSSDVPMRSHTSPFSERVRLRLVFSSRKSWRSLSSAAVSSR